MTGTWKDLAREAQEKAVIEAATKLFESKGYFMTTMDEIAEEANISKATIYKLFPSKEELFIKVAESLHEELISRLHFQSEGGFPEVFTFMINSFLETLYERAGLIRMVVFESFQAPLFVKEKSKLLQMIRKNRERYMGVLQNVLKKGVEEGYVKFPPEVFAKFLLAVFKGIFAEVIFQHPEELKALADFTRDRVFELAGLKEVKNV